MRRPPSVPLMRRLRVWARGRVGAMPLVCLRPFQTPPHTHTHTPQRPNPFLPTHPHTHPRSRQPAVNGARSDHPIFGWGGPGGNVYQKAYIECFTSPQNLKRCVGVGVGGVVLAVVVLLWESLARGGGGARVADHQIAHTHTCAHPSTG